MSGWLVVQSHPYYAVTDDSGDFTLPNVPAGYYRLETWHEVLGRQMRSLSVPAGGESTVTISYYQQTQYPHLAQLRNRALSAIRTLIPWELPSRPR